MKIIDIYLFKQTCVMIFIVLGGIAGLLFVTGLADEAARRVNDTYTLSNATLFIIARIPSDLQEYLAVIIMLGTLISVASLNKHQELTVIQLTAGSTVGLVTRLILPALILLPFLFYFGQWITPVVKHWAESERALLLGKHQPTLTGEWYRVGDELINVERVISNEELAGLTQFKLGPDQTLESVTFSPLVHYENENWSASNAKNIEFSANSVTKTNSEQQNLTSQLFSPTMLNSLVRDYDELSLPKLYQLMDFRKTAGTLTPELELTLWQRMLYPIEFIAMLLIAVAMAMGSFRQRTVGDAAFKTLIIGVVAGLMLKTLSSALALLALPIVLAVIITNLGFLMGAVFFLKKRL